MTQSIDFVGTPGDTYVPPGTHTLYATGGAAFVFAADGISVGVAGGDSFIQFVDSDVISGDSSAEAVIDWNGASVLSEAGFCWIDTDHTGFSVIMQGTTLKFRKEIEGGGDATIASTSVDPSGVFTLRTEFTASGDITAKIDGSTVLTGSYTDTLSGLRVGIQHYEPGVTTQLYRSLDTVTGGGGGPTGGKLKVWNGSAWEDKPVKVYNGASWVEKPVKVYNGSTWELT